MKYEEKYNKIVNECNKILIKKESIHFIANNIFNNQRFNSNFFDKFNFIFCDNILLLLNTFFKNFLKFIIIILKSFFINKINIKSKNKIIFYSNCNNKKTDLYFSNIKSELKKYNKKFSTIYLNIDFKNDKIIKNDIHLQVIPDLVTLIRILPIILKSMIIFIIELFKVNNSLEKKIYLCALVNAFSWETIYNLKLYFILKNLKNKQYCFFYPFEGYGHEKIINNIFRSDRNLIIGYQHTILYKSSNLLNKINKIYLPDLILCSSNYYLKKLKKKLSKQTKFIVLGKKINLVKTKNDNGRILVIPEGDRKEVNYFVKFLYNFLKLNLNDNFTLRIHPVFKYNKKILIKKFSNFKDRVIISDKKFAEDISLHRITLYSGSSAILDCIRNKNLPVYININSKYDNNPLSEIKSKIREIKSAEELNNFLKNGKIKHKENYPFIKRYVNQLFEDLKKPQFANLIRYIKNF